MSLSLTIFISVLLGVNRGQVHLLHIQSEKCILQRTVDRKTASNMKLFLCLTALAALYCAVESRYSEYEFVLFTFDKHFNRFYLKKNTRGRAVTIESPEHYSMLQIKHNKMIAVYLSMFTHFIRPEL